MPPAIGALTGAGADVVHDNHRGCCAFSMVKILVGVVAVCVVGSAALAIATAWCGRVNGDTQSRSPETLSAGCAFLLRNSTGATNGNLIAGVTGGGSLLLGLGVCVINAICQLGKTEVSAPNPAPSTPQQGSPPSSASAAGSPTKLLGTP